MPFGKLSEKSSFGESLDKQVEACYTIKGGMTLDEWKAAFRMNVLTATAESRKNMQELLDKLEKV